MEPKFSRSFKLLPSSCFKTLPLESGENLQIFESHIARLPIDLLLAIFFKLSIEDVLSSRSVCKSWNDLISNPNFSTSYSRNSPFTTILFSQRSYTSMHFFLLEVAPNEEFIQRPIKPKIPNYSEPDSYLSIIGSFNGLLFLLLREEHNSRVKEQVYFCNPLFGGCFKLGDYKIIHENNWFTQYKLGFVSSINKFKLLRIAFKKDGRFQEANILTVGLDDNWRKLEDSLTLSTNTCGISFNGDYHWFVNDKNDDYIYTFDFGKEKSCQISKAPGMLQKGWLRNLIVFRNRLCVIEFSYESNEMIIWTMEEYLNAGSWSRSILLRSWFSHRMHLSELLQVFQDRDIMFTLCMCIKLARSSGTKKCTEIGVSDRDVRLLEKLEFSSYTTLYAPRFYSIQKDIARGWST